MEEFKVEDKPVLEDATFTNKAFLNFDGSPKKVVVVNCPKGNPEAFPDERIMLMKNYKSDIERGRKDSLKDKNVIVVLTDKGPYMIPLEEAKTFASYLWSVANAVESKLK